jgi:4-methyl-5(b-hydroxyethyl)-thiazole monophosphate biosynthesis
MKNIIILLAKGFEEYETGIIATVMGWSNTYGSEKVGVYTAGLHNEVASAQNIIVKPSFLTWNINVDKFDALFVPGGIEAEIYFEDAFSTNFLDLIKMFYHNEKIIASVALGSLPLAKSGILFGRKATTFPYLNGIHVRQLNIHGAVVVPDKMVVEEKLITSATPDSAINVAFKLLELLTSKQNCRKIIQTLKLDNKLIE